MPVNSTLSARPSGAQDHTRYGCFPVVIGAMLEHLLSQRLTLPSGRTLGVGQRIHTEVQDITRHPEADGHTQWVCRSPHCTGKTWASKKDLVAAHPNNRDLKKDMEVHCFYAVAHVPAIAGKPETTDKHGNVTAEAIPAEPAKLILLSDEE